MSGWKTSRVGEGNWKLNMRSNCNVSMTSDVTVSSDDKSYRSRKLSSRALSMSWFGVSAVLIVDITSPTSVTARSIQAAVADTYEQGVHLSCTTSTN